MRCPNCGTENADEALFCSACGASLTDDGSANAANQTPEATVDAESKARLVEERTRKLSEVLAGETRQINDADKNMQPVFDAAKAVVEDRASEEALEAAVDEILYGSSEKSSEGDSLPDVDEPHDGETVVDLAPVDPTMLRPVPQEAEEQHFVVRNTRDYDHDAQSINLASNPENFDTLTPGKTRREVRRDPYARGSRKGEAPGEGNSRSKLRPLLALLLVALILGGGGSVLTYGLELWGGKSVPDVVGEKQATAEFMLTEKGFAARLEAEPADDAIGRVLSQDPSSGIRLPEGSEVTIVVATNRTIPEVVGLAELEAKQLLTDSGAERIEVQTKASSEAEGTVIAVSPEVGQAFVSRGTVTLTVAVPFTVPDVIGKKESDAINELTEAGYGTDVSYVASSETVRTVVETSPAAGERIEEGGTVQVKVSSPYPSDPYHLLEYFDHSSQDVDQYLQKQGFAFDQGFIDSFGNALATYKSDDKGNVTFSSQPYVRSHALPKEGSSNVLSTGVSFAGFRIDLPAEMCPSGFERKDLEELAKTCGFEGSMDFIDNKTMATPSGYAKTTASFACGGGREGDLVWTVCVVGSGSSKHASVTCARESVYQPADVSLELAKFGNSVVQFVAFQEAYLTSDYAPAQEKKTDNKKDDKKTDAKDSEKNDADSANKNQNEAQEGESDTEALEYEEEYPDNEWE